MKEPLQALTATRRDVSRAVAAPSDRTMSHFGLALLIVVAAAIAVRAILYAVGVQAPIADGFATVAFAAIVPVHQFLDTKEVTINLAGLSRRRLMSLDEFSLPWYILLAYGTLVLV